MRMGNPLQNQGQGWSAPSAMSGGGGRPPMMRGGGGGFGGNGYISRLYIFIFR